ncbi:MAG: virulence RhuM family protein [Deltaproteobacteria bacterium]|nr:virulence RhuM family protein [Deltaproteobacteria bacterium]
MPQKALAELFAVGVPEIRKHLQNIFESAELQEEAVVSVLETTAADGKRHQTRFYNLDAIIAVGYRVNAFDATQFRHEPKVPFTQRRGKPNGGMRLPARGSAIHRTFCLRRCQIGQLASSSGHELTSHQRGTAGGRRRATRGRGRTLADSHPRDRPCDPAGRATSAGRIDRRHLDRPTNARCRRGPRLCRCAVGGARGKDRQDPRDPRHPGRRNTCARGSIRFLRPLERSLWRERQREVVDRSDSTGRRYMPRRSPDSLECIRGGAGNRLGPATSGRRRRGTRASLELRPRARSATPETARLRYQVR